MLIKQLSTNDGIDVYNMLQEIGANENEFKNTAYGLSFDEFKIWLHEQDDWSKGKSLPRGFVPQTVFWLYDGDSPVGIGKIRHKLNDHSREIGGNIGYAIASSCRGKGYATFLLSELIKAADALGIEEKLLTVEKVNPASKVVIEKNGGSVIKENDERWYFSF